jgi:hypothetical protein
VPDGAVRRGPHRRHFSPARLTSSGSKVPSGGWARGGPNAECSSYPDILSRHHGSSGGRVSAMRSARSRSARPSPGAGSGRDLSAICAPRMLVDVEEGRCTLAASPPSGTYSGFSSLPTIDTAGTSSPREAAPARSRRHSSAPPLWNRLGSSAATASLESSSSHRGTNPSAVQSRPSVVMTGRRLLPQASGFVRRISSISSQRGGVHEAMWMSRVCSDRVTSAA